MCANGTGGAQTFLSASDAAVSQEVADGKSGSDQPALLTPDIYTDTSTVEGTSINCHREQETVIIGCTRETMSHRSC
jgi:hypothetical protein